MNCLAVVGAGIEKSIEDFKKKTFLCWMVVLLIVENKY
jgi:hypothetical protein